MRHPIHGALFVAATLLSAPAFAQDAGEPAAPTAAAQQDTPQAAPEAAPATAPAEQAAASTETAQPDPASDAPAQDAAAPADTVAQAKAAGHIAAPPPGKGQVVFFREKKFAGSAVRYKVREGTNELGKLSSGTYFVHVTDPGAHEYTVHSEAKDVLNLEVEDGETYYVIGGVSMGMFVGRPNLSPSDASAFDGMFAKLKLAE